MRKGLVLILFTLGFINCVFSQTIRPTLEWEKNGSNANITAFGPSLSPISVTSLKDLQNPTIPSLVPTYTIDANPLITTLSLRNQTRSTTLTGTATVLQGITFGGRNTDDNSASVGGDDPVGTPGVQTVGGAILYNTFAADIPASKPLNNMYVTSPSSPAYPLTSVNSNTTGSTIYTSGFDTQAITGAQGPDAVDLGGGVLGGDDDNNYGIPVYVTVEPLHDIAAAVNGKYFYGELVINFNRTVKNPMVHLGGLGGSYTYIASPAAGGGIFNANFTTELELVNGETPTAMQVMAGNLNISVVGNQILNTSTTPNAGSVQGDASYGAASGSIKVNGNYSQLVFKVYMKGSASSFGWSQTAANISSANRDPLNGDLWYISISTDIPTQQVSGNVFLDTDMTAGDIWRNVSNGTPYVKTDGSLQGETINSTLPTLFYANLISNAGLVLSSVPIARDGSYLFDNIAPGTYSVSISSGALTPGNPPTNGYTPPGFTPSEIWINTGQQIGLVSGTDGNNDGRSAPFTLSSGQVLPNVNFGVFMYQTLPVDLVSFNGILNGNISKLKWVVENEIQFDDYDLERSVDGINFSKIATINTRGLGAAQQTYNYDDNLAGFTGKVYYRLKMNNLDRSFKYSNIVIVRLSKIKTTDIYPNPFTQFIKVEVESAAREKALIKVIDLNGIVVVNQSAMLQIGGNQITINNLAKLAQGTYFLEITTSTEIIREKLIKLK
jgi:hypothetical protein